jgi:hypothetical protein
MSSQGFFDSYPAFFATSRTMAVPNRLNRRYDALIGRNAAVLRDAAIVDLGAHDGRWSFAALKTGARHVTGIEARPHLVANATATMSKYDIPTERYRFVCGDAHEELRALAPGSVDVVLCLGFFHETMRHADLLHAIHLLGPRHLIMDVWIHPRTTDPVIRLYVEDPDLESSSYPYRSATGQPIVGHPSRSALELMLADAGFGKIDYFDWLGVDLEDWNHLEDYRERRRLSLIAVNLHATKR